jgi:hypothetical protein
VLAVAIATGVALSNDPAEVTGQRATQSTLSTTTPASSTPLSGATGGATTSQTSAAATVPLIQDSRERDAADRRPDIPVREPGVRSSSVASSASFEAAGSAPRTTAQVPASAAPEREQASGAPAQVTPLPSAPPASAAPAVAAGCEGFADVCSAIRAEMARAFQRAGITMAANRASADAAVTAAVTLVSETPSADFGTPMLTRTYSVELIGSARGAALATPEPRRFSFDARFGGARLDENARLIAADAVESVRAFFARPSR